ncbi:MAG: hypothetical protein IKN45_10185 [Lachnospiraceae bacterium]|nr:hypothetical protein [Lachnospiraceae bacterium]
MIWDDEINDDYDFKRLRKDLETEYLIQGIGFTGDFGLFEMLEASGASNEELIKMAKREHINLEKYRK